MCVCGLNALSFCLPNHGFYTSHTLLFVRVHLLRWRISQLSRQDGSNGGLIRVIAAVTA